MTKVRTPKQLEKQLEKIMQKKLAAQVDQVLDIVSSAQLINLNQRLDAGVGLDDSTMPELTERYAKRRNKSRVRNLLLSGHMRRGMRVVKRPFVHRIGFGDSNAKDKAKWNHKLHRWFGISRNDRASLMKVIKTALGRK